MNLRRVRTAVASLALGVVAAVGISAAPDDSAAPPAQAYSQIDTGWGFK